MLLPGALNSVQLAKVSREMDFKQVFRSNIGGVILSGIAGIVLAKMGAGLWALVAQTLLNTVFACIVMFITVKWRPRLVCDLKRVKVLFSFGWKLLASSLLDTLYQDIRSLVIGKKYDADTLGYYNRGKQFPQFVINAINGAVQSVLLPAMSENQDEKETVKLLVKNAICVSSYIIFPMMAGLACVGNSLIRLLLTEKWLPAVPYMWVSCFCYSFYTIYVSNLQAMNAVGRSDWFLKLEIIKKIYSIAMLVVAVVCFDTPMAIAMSGAVTAGLDWYVNSFPNKKLIGYSCLEQVRDLLPVFLLTALMGASVIAVGYGCSLAGLHDVVTLALQVATGVTVYVLLSVMVKPYPYRMVMETAKNMLQKKHS
jgi:O-antigen/teichoic acid export membrane protein